MGLRARDFTRLAREVVEPTLREAGFARSKTHPASPEWVRPSGAGWLVFWFQNDARLGGQFTCEFQLPRGVGDGPRSRFFRLLTAEQREAVRVIQNEVIASFPVAGPDAIASAGRSFIEVVAESWTPIREPYPARTDVWLRYTGEDDARRWLEWLAPLLPLLADRFEDDPGRFNMYNLDGASDE